MATPKRIRTARLWLLLVSFSTLLLMGALWRTYVATVPERRNQAMVRAVAAGNIALARYYLAEGADPNTVFRYLNEPSESQGISPQALWIRMRGGPGAPHVVDGPTALMRAVKTDNPLMVQLLLGYGADVNRLGGYNTTALSQTRNIEIIRMLKHAGAKQ